MNILLIGGTGVLSTDIVNYCVKNNHHTYVLNRGTRKYLLNKNVDLIQADINDTETIKDKTRRLYFDVVVDFISYNKCQLERSLNLFYKKCNHYIFISSVAVYNRMNVNGFVTEDDIANAYPLWDYSINKLICENFLINKCTELGLKYTIVRPSITYGNTRIPYGIMPPYGRHWTLIARIQNNKPIIIWDGGKTICTITHTRDFAKGVIGLFNNPEAYNETFNIVGDNRYTWNEVLQTISEIIDKNIVTVDIPSTYIADKIPYLRGIMLGDRAVDAKYNNIKIKNAVVNFSCEIDLKTGISQTIEYYIANNYLDGIDYKWDAEVDRLIYNYLKKKDPVKLSELKLNFINYMFDPYTDKIKYIMNRYNSLVILTQLIRIIKNIYIK